MSSGEWDHIRDTDTVFMQHPRSEAVGSCLGAAFKAKYGPEGYTQTDQAAWQAWMDHLNEERAEFVASGNLATLPDGEPAAQDVINGERGGRPAAAGPPPEAVAAAKAAGVPVAEDQIKAGKHRGEG